MKPTIPYIIFLLLLACPFSAFSQEESPVIYQGSSYLDCNIHSLDKYAKRIDRQQEKLLARLKRKEARLFRQLSHKDLAAYAKLHAQPLSYDSIARLRHADSNSIASKSRKSQPAIDSLKKIQAFLQTKATALNTGGTDLGQYNGKLSELQTRLSYQQYIQGLIDQRNLNLKNGLGALSAKIPAFKGIQEQVFYAKAKANVFRQLADDPSAAEEKALEYLQGEKGFDQALSKPAEGSMQTATSIDDLEKMGFQTKRQLNAQLQQQYDSNLGSLQEKMGNQVSEWQNKAGGLTAKVDNAAQQLKTASADAQQTKQSLKQLKNIQKPAFKINPMRGLPFMQRIEKQYGFQTSRATTDGQPAMLQLSAMAGFKHTPKLSYGLGVAGSFGLGQSWSDIRLTFEGIGLRSYTSWTWQYGVGVYAGYERVYKLNHSSRSSEIAQPQPSIHNASSYSESVLLGLTKSYKVNSKWNGQIQLLYDVWWMEKGMRSPIILRFATTSK